MSEQEERKTWYVGETLPSSSRVYEGSPDFTIGDFVCECDRTFMGWQSAVNRAKQIADDHNRIPELEQRAERAEAALAALVEAASALVDEGPFYDSEHGQYDCCGERWSNAHAANCPYIATRRLIEQARIVLPPSQTEETQ